MDTQMRMLAEACDYKGISFEENYLFSNLLRAFYEDAETYGLELAEDMYVTMLGEDSKELFEEIIDDYDSLEEVVLSTRSTLLFEGYADKDILNEAPSISQTQYQSMLDKLRSAGITQSLKNKPTSGEGLSTTLSALAGKGASQAELNRFKKAVANTEKGQGKLADLMNKGREAASSKGAELTKGSGGAPGAKQLGFLQKIWEKIKDFGGETLGKLKDLAGKGVGWAKDIFQQGASFFTANPIAQVAIPAVVIAGGAVAGWKFYKKMKKKKGEKVSKEEKEKFKQAIEQNKDKLKKYNVKVA